MVVTNRGRRLVVRRMPWLLTGCMTELPLVRAARIPVTDTFHGVDVTEKEVAGAGGRLRGRDRRLDQGSAGPQRHLFRRDRLANRAAGPGRELLKFEKTAYLQLRPGGGTFFALKVQTPRQQPFLVALTDPGDVAAERVVVDPDVIDPSGETTIDFFVPSPDGTKVAVSLSDHGTEDGTLHVYDAGTGEVVDEPIRHVNLTGGSVAWRHDGSGFWYTLCADPAGFRKQGWFRDLGNPGDRLDLAGPFADERIAEHRLSASPDGRWVMDRCREATAVSGRSSSAARRPGARGGWWRMSPISACGPC